MFIILAYTLVTVVCNMFDTLILKYTLTLSKNNLFISENLTCHKQDNSQKALLCHDISYEQKYARSVHGHTAALVI